MADRKSGPAQRPEKKVPSTVATVETVEDECEKDVEQNLGDVDADEETYQCATFLNETGEDTIMRIR
jgi:hypothetical protein